MLGSEITGCHDSISFRVSKKWPAAPKNLDGYAYRVPSISLRSPSKGSPLPSITTPHKKQGKGHSEKPSRRNLQRYSTNVNSFLGVGVLLLRHHYVSAAGEGDKQLLRQALLILGLPRASRRVKRAIQFGTRLGKLANMQAFGSNRSGQARHAGTMRITEVEQLRAKASKGNRDGAEV